VACRSLGRPWLACALIAVAGLASVSCDVGTSSDSADSSATAENGATDADGTPRAGARSALGKAKERAEKLVNEDVAEYNKKIEQAAEGKYP
jgi:hypothetical protein